eukprot:COSAG06_NODE_3502_length_5253_cov_2.040109_7_plen_83_part_00
MYATHQHDGKTGSKRVGRKAGSSHAEGERQDSPPPEPRCDRPAWYHTRYETNRLRFSFSDVCPEPVWEIMAFLNTERAFPLT